jgi:tryptophan synthase beta chain
MADRYKFLLDEKDIPKAWYNAIPDLPRPLPPVLHPGTLKPVGPEDLSPILPMALILQEVSQESWIEIPEPVREVYKLWRPTPLMRAHRLERLLDTPAHIYYKYEGVSPSGSHKPNTAVPQVFYNKEAGIKGLTTETGAGQWGTALSFSCKAFGLECYVYMVKASYEQKPYRRIMMESYGAEVTPSPSEKTDAGRKILAEDPNSPGSLGIAISEAVEAAVKSGGRYKYSLGSVLNHVLTHQTVIGQEAIKQMEMAGEYPDILIAPTGGGSNFAGLVAPFLRENLKGGKSTRIIAVEPTSCPSLTKGVYAYDFGDAVGLTPLIKMYTLGHTFVPPRIHSGGLRYHGMASIVNELYDQKLIEAVAVQQRSVFEAGLMFAGAEGILPAPEAAHAARVAIDEALKCKAEGKKRVIVFNLCGHGHLDLSAYDDYIHGRLVDYDYPAEKVADAISHLPKVDAAALAAAAT